MAANAKFFLTAQDLTGPAFGSVNKRLGSAGKRVAQFAGSIAAAAGIGGMGLLIKNAVDAGDAIHKLNLRLGASAVALSEYQHVAELSGVKFEALTKAWQKQQDGIADAVSGTGEARVALDKLGLSAQALSKLAPEEQFEAIAAALGGVEQAGDRVNIAQDIWGAKGAQLLQVTAGGADAIKHMRDEAHALGLTLTQTGAQNMADINDATTRLSGGLNGVANIIVQQFGPALTEIINDLAFGLPRAATYAVGAVHMLARGYYNAAAAIAEMLAWRDKVDADFAESGIGKVYNWVTGNGTADEIRARSREHAEAAVEFREKADEHATALIAIVGELAQKKFEIQPGSPLALLGGDAEGLSNKTERLKKEQDELAVIYKAGLDKVTAREKKAHADRLAMQQSYFSSTASILGSLSTLQAGASWKAFNASKNLAKGEIVVSTIASAQKAYQSAAAFGPWAAAGAALAASLAGAARWKAVDQTQFGGSAPSAAGGGGGTFPVNPVSGIPQAPQAATAQPEQRIIIQIGDAKLAELVVKGAKVAADNDALVFRTADGYQTVFIA